MKALPSALVVLPLLFSAVMVAQDAPAVRQGTTEVAGFAGLARDANGFRVMGGGNLAHSVTRHVMVYGEFTYFPKVGAALLPSTTPGFALPPGTRVDFAYTTALDDIHGGVHFRFPVKESRIVPYAAAGVGVLRFSPSDFTAVVTVPGVAQPFVFPGLHADAVSRAAVNLGGGLRFYFNEKFGMRLEGKAYKAVETNVFGKVTVGFFYQIH